jgi:predicted nucleotidyltransferase
MRSLPTDRPLDPVSLEILRAVKASANELNIPVMLVGATARDIMLTYLHDIPAQRATEDMDFALAVPTWEAFDDVTQRLTDDARFVMSKSATNRVAFHYSEKQPARSVDVVPYGAGGGSEVFRWPKNNDIEMNVAGYEDAARAAESVGMAADLSFDVATLPGLTLLKHFAWLDRRTATSKDAFDLALILHTYADAGNLERLFGEEIGIMEAVDFDLGLAAPRLLGRDVASICSEATRGDMATLLSDTSLMDKLALDMLRAQRSDTPDATRSVLDQFRAGFDLN